MRPRSQPGQCELICNLKCSLRTALPHPWFVPGIAIEAACNLLLKFGLKMGCDELLRQVEVLYQQEVRPKLRTPPPSRHHNQLGLARTAG